MTPMNIAIIGLGLIGGSLAKTVKAKTPHVVYGYDISATGVHQALASGAVDFTPDGDYSDIDLILVALCPFDAVAFMRENIARFKPGSTVVDMCGVKRCVCRDARDIFENSGVTFIGGHPMAGKENSGFASAAADLFNGASMILTPFIDTPADKLAAARDFFLSLGFGGVTVTTPERHDEIIAYTSQLAHIVSGAYVKSPLAQNHMGFSAGSFKDMTRVAKLNEDMWSELFLANGDFLIRQIDLIIQNLADFRDAIDQNDRDVLRTLLAKGREIKEELE